MKKFEKVEGEAVSKVFLKIGELCKAFFVWAWELDSDDVGEYIMGSFLISLLVACGLLVLFGLTILFWAAFKISWLWIFSWPPAIALVTLFEIRAVKGIVALHDDFF
jgi:uncharacterized protein (DUF983 family)